MAGFSNIVPSFVKRNPGASFLATVILGVGAVFSIYGSSGGSALFQCYTGTGCVVGTLAVTNSLTVGGASIPSQSAADARYVNTSGDVMTGTLSIQNSKNLHVAGTISGTTLKLLGFGSGNYLHAEKGFSASGSSTVRGSFSGNTIFGKRCPQSMSIQYTASGTALAANSGTTLVIPIPMEMTGYTLAKFIGTVDQQGTTGLTRFGLRDFNKGKRQMFTTFPSIDSAETSTLTAATAYVIGTADVAGGDKLSFDVLQVQTTAPKGLSLYLTFSCPAS